MTIGKVEGHSPAIAGIDDGHWRLARHGSQLPSFRFNLVLVVQQEVDALSAPSLAKDLVSRSSPLGPGADVDSELAT